MEKSILEKRIQEKAEEKYNSLLLEAKNFFYSNLIMRKLKFKIGDCGQYSLNNNMENVFDKITNINEVKKEIIQLLEQEETDNILSKLSVLEYYLKGE